MAGDELDRLARLTADMGARRSLFRLIDGSEVESKDERITISGNDRPQLITAAVNLADQLSRDRGATTQQRDGIFRTCMLTYATLQALHRIAAGESSRFLATTFGTFDLARWHDDEVLPVLHLLDELQSDRAAAAGERTLTGVPESLVDASTFPFAGKVEITIRPLSSKVQP